MNDRPVSKVRNITAGQATAAVRAHRRPKVVGLSAARKKARRKTIEARIRKTIDGHLSAGGDIAGFALVVWDHAGGSTADMATEGGVSPTMMIPDFVRNRLLAEKVEEWTIDAVNRANGY